MKTNLEYEKYLPIVLETPPETSNGMWHKICTCILETIEGSVVVVAVAASSGSTESTMSLCFCDVVHVDNKSMIWIKSHGIF